MAGLRKPTGDCRFNLDIWGDSALNIEMAAAIIAYLLILVAIVLTSRQLVRAAFCEVSDSGLPLNTLALLLGIPLFLITFSLLARIIPWYGITLPATALTLLGAGRLASGSWGRLRQKTSWPDRISLLFLVGLFVPCYLLRIQWPALHWENSVERIGVERMFNVSMQQAFLRGNGWPVENLWLAGEPIDYHILLRALPGLGSWLTRALSGETLAGGVIYLLNDVLFLTLAPTAFVAFALVLVRTLYPNTAASRLAMPIVSAALLCFLAPNATAIVSSLSYLFFHHGLADFWSLQHAVVPGTVSYYPFGLLLSGESHSYAQAPVLSITWLGLLLLHCTTPKKNAARTLILALLGAAVALSHAATAIVCGLVALPLFIGEIATPALRRHSSLRLNLLHAAILAGGALLAMLPTYREHMPPQMRVVLVPPQLASNLLAFASVHFFSMCLLACGTAVLLLTTRNTSWCQLRSPKNYASIALILLLWLVMWQRPVIALSFTLAVSSFILLGSSQKVAVLAFCGALLVWIFPEVIVTDWVHDNRTDWVRFNTAMRLWLESTYLVPFAGMLIVAPALEILLQSKFFGRCAATVTAILLIVVVVSDYVLTERRIARAPERASIDGFDFLRSEAPYDFQIISYLSLLPNPVVLGEVCGDGSHDLLPYHYGKPGRIAAFSGRPSLCGWARHTWMFQQRLRRANPSNETLWQSFLSYNNHFKNILSAGSPNPLNLAPIEESLLYLKSRGVTHLVVGELEQQVQPRIDLSTLAIMIGGEVLFEPSPGFGVVKMPQEIANNPSATNTFIDYSSAELLQQKA